MTPAEQKAAADARKKAAADAKKPKATKMAVSITAKKGGFRRCGIAHPGEATEYPEGHFSKKQLAIMDAEPMLVVTHLK